LCWDLQTLLLPKLLHEREKTLCLGLQSLHPLPLGLPLGKQGLLSLLKTLHLGLQYLTPMFQ
jgi:hypothetical protein